ncbi:hypothetical protein JW964_19170 [candidate division KSB1 bacterium]|nr:hypothetical protein [candidate division KSB1 bacterium]
MLLKHFYYLFLIFFILTLFEKKAKTQPPTNFEFNVLNKKLVYGAQPIDINQDGEDEIFIQLGDEIDIYDARILTHRAYFGVPALKFNYCPLVTGRLDSLAFITYHGTKDSVYWDLLIKKFTPREEERKFKRFISFSGVDLDKDGKFHQSGWPIGYIKNHAGQQLLVFTLNSARDKAKRGLMAVIPQTGEIVWEFLCAPQVQIPIFFDADGDNYQEIVFGSYAPDNLLKINGTTDDSCYIFLLNCEGKLLWRKPMGGPATGAIPAVNDINGDQKLDLIAYRYSNEETNKDMDRIVRFDLKTGKVVDSVYSASRIPHTPSVYKQDYCQDLNNDGQAEIVIGSRDGVVRIYDFDLKIRYNSKPFASPVSVAEITDLTGDGLKEIVCLTADFRMLFFDHELKLLGEKEVPSRTAIKKVQTKYKNYLLLTSPAMDNQFEIQLVEFRWSPFSKETIQQTRIYMEWLLAAGFILGMLYLIRNWLLGRNTQRIFMQFLEHAGLKGQVLIVKKKLEVVFMGEKWGQLLNSNVQDVVGKNFKDLTDKNPSLNKVVLKSIKGDPIVQRIELENQQLFMIQSHYLALQRLFLILLIDLSEKEHVRQVKSWASVAQRLAHGIKNPLTTIKLNAEDLFDLLREKYQVDTPEVQSSIQDIIDQADRLTRMTDGFMRFTNFEKPVLSRIDINQKMKEWLPQWLPGRPRIELQFNFFNELPKIQVDGQQIETALKNIVFNAVQSMPEGGKLIVSTRKVEVFPKENDWMLNRYFVEIEFRDTGKGFPKEFREKVFEPYFSFQKKEGTGLGLTLVKKIIADHGGEIIIDSEEGSGTCVGIRLPIQK